MAEMTVAEALAFVENAPEWERDPYAITGAILAAEVRRLQADVAQLEMRPTQGELRQAERERLEWKAQVERLTNDYTVTEDGRVQHQDLLKAIALAVGAENFSDILPAVRAAVEAAFREGFVSAQFYCVGKFSHGTPDAAWAASTAKREAQR